MEVSIISREKEEEFIGYAKKQYQERMQRISDAISLKIPDRVPIAPDPGFFPFMYAEVSLKEAMYDYEKAHDAWIKTVTTFKWDATMPPYSYSANVFEILGYKQLLWPGHGLKDDAVAFQFVEPDQIIGNKVWYEAMKPEEYDCFLDDPSDYLLRVYLPRVFERLEPLYNVIPIHGIICWYQGLFEALSTPNIVEVFQILTDAACKASKWLNSFVNFIQRLKSLGFPLFSLACTHAPFDYVANFLRGTKGAFIDIFRCPDKLIKACEKITPWMVQAGVMGAKSTGNPIISIFLHKGAFMNPVQFRTFYWSSLKKVISGLIDNNLIPYVCTEGNYTPFFEIIKEVPKGKVIYHIEKDIFKAKEALGERVCLTGGPPNSLLITGTPKDVMKYCKKVIATAGEGGGYIMDAEAPLINANPLNVKAMTDSVMKYGRYKK